MAAVLLLVVRLLSAGSAEAAWTTDPHANLEVSSTGPGLLGPGLLADGRGGVFVSGLSATGQPALQHVTAQGALDPAWPPAGKILGRAVPAGTVAPLLVDDGAHGALATWRDGACLRVAHVLEGGQVAAGWPDSGLAVCAADPLSAQATFAATSDRFGGEIVAWFDAGNATRSIYAQHVRWNGTVDPAWPAGWVTLHTGSTAIQQPVMAPDVGGGAFLVWTDYVVSTGNIVAQHVAYNGARHPSWAPDGNTICDASGTQSAPAAAPDGQGGLFVAWQDERPNAGAGPADIYLQRVASYGTPVAGWPLGGRVLCDAAGAQTGVALAPDDSGGVYAAWTDARGADRDVYVTRCGADEAISPGWPAQGLAVCTAAGDQGPVRIVADGRGAAIVAWADARTPATGVPDQYAQRVLRRGVVDPAWPADGVAVSTAAGGQSAQAAVADGAGGTVVAWADTRGASAAVYAQRVANDGTLGGDVVVGVPPAPLGAALALAVAPNPARGRTVFRFAQLSPGRVTLTVHDVRGRRVAVVASGAFDAGEHDVPWDVRGLAPGVYLARLRVGRGEVVRRVVVLGEPGAR